MGSLKRKLERNKLKKKIKDTKRDLKAKTGLFHKLGDECLNCQKAFDKTSKKMALEWTVVVREAEEKVNLYCPECWESGKKIIEEIKGDLNDN
tara:strand:+ start:784 stop:1062 length:279 start_codon:yes stop_codon:yes gene_type:complete